jgi:asparagine N-glycosylation enzyme membrane subunit Stt3
VASGFSGVAVSWGVVGESAKKESTRLAVVSAGAAAVGSAAGVVSAESSVKKSSSPGN